MKKMKDWGEASNTGFTVTVRGKTAQSKCYTEEDIEFTGKHYVAYGAILLFYYFILMLVLRHLNFGRLTQELSSPTIFDAFMLLLAAISSVPMMIILLSSSIYGKNFPEYHACEHKVATLLEKRLQPNLKNLKKMPRVSPYCGSFKIGILATIPLALSIFIALTMYLSWAWWNFFVAFFFMVCLAFASTFLLQFFFLTREPSEEKLKEALEVAEEFYK